MFDSSLRDYSTQLLKQLSELPAQILAAERKVAELQQKQRAAQDALKARESDLLLGRDPQVQIDGKNAETRAAQLTQATAAERAAIRELEAALAQANADLDYLKYTYRAVVQAAHLTTTLLAVDAAATPVALVS